MYRNIPPLECSTQLNVIAPSLLLSLKRSRKVPVFFSCSRARVLFLFTNPMMKLKPTWERTTVSGLMKKKWFKHHRDDSGRVLPFPPKVHQVFFDQVQDSINPNPSTFVLFTQERKRQRGGVATLQLQQRHSINYNKNRAQDWPWRTCSSEWDHQDCLWTSSCIKISWK